MKYELTVWAPNLMWGCSSDVVCKEGKKKKTYLL